MNDWFGTETITLLLDTALYVPSFIGPALNVSPGSVFTVQDLAGVVQRADAQFQEYVDYAAYRYQELVDHSIQSFGTLFLGRFQLYASLLHSYVFGSGQDPSDNPLRTPSAIIEEALPETAAAVAAGARKAWSDMVEALRRHYLRFVPGLHLHVKSTILALRSRFPVDSADVGSATDTAVGPYFPTPAPGGTTMTAMYYTLTVR